MERSRNESPVSDFDYFEKSLQHLHDRLLQDYLNDDHRKVIIALSRKGPKMVNTIFTEEERAQLNIVTEFAMPLLFANQEKGISMSVYILDDAVYYGSTLLNLYNEIKRYEYLFGLNLQVRAYVAIRDESALYFSNPEINADDSYRKGFGHYFVKKAMSRFLGLHQCMEVEFPSVTYTFSNIVDANDLFGAFNEKFRGSCYVGSYLEGEIVNVVLPRHDCQFCKFRMYLDGRQVRLTFMSPRVIPNDETVIRHLMNEMGDALKKLWRKICDEILKEGEDAKTAEALKRSRRRNLVSFANYIFTYQEYIFYKSDIENVFRQIDSRITVQDINAGDLYQIIGNKSFATELQECLKERFDMDSAVFPMIPSVPVSLDELSYEEPRNPLEEERRTLESHNRHMIRNSHSFKEALSAIFFNQNLFIERWSRTKVRSETRHLWFGYTHDTLKTMLERHGRFLHPANEEVELHKWIDNRIDMGCIVPQYILDYASNQWLRVFRPGENEELLLSHLARFVVHVYNKVEERLALGYVPDHFLRNMLAVIYKRYWHQGLADQFSFTLDLAADHRLTLSDNDSEGETEVIKYLQKMYILEDNDGEITIAPRITDDEFKTATTIDKDVLAVVDNCIKEVLDKFNESKLSVDRDYAIFNFYLNEDLSDEQLAECYQDIARQIMRAVKMIDTGIDIGDNNFVNAICQSLLLQSYHKLIDYDVEVNMFLSGENLTTEQYWHRFDTDLRFRSHVQIRRLLYILNLLISIYAIANFNNFKAFTNNIANGNYLDMIGLGVLRDTLNSTLTAGNFKELHTTHRLTRVLMRVLEQIAS